MTASERVEARILVVEDDALVALDLESALESMSYEVVAVGTNAEEAISLAARSRPDLALLDIRLPGDRDGIEAGTVITSRLGIPVVYLTAHADLATVTRAKQAGSAGYLVKPFAGEELRATIEVALYRHQAEMLSATRPPPLEPALAALNDGILVTDTLGTVTHANPAMTLLLECEAEDLVGKRSRQVLSFYGAKGLPLDDPVDTALRYERRVHLTGETQIRTARGSWKAVSGTVTIMRDTGDEPLGVVMNLAPRLD